MLVQPKLEYGASAWSPNTEHGVNKLERVQRSAARFVTNNHTHITSVSSLLTNIGWQTLERRRLKSQLSMLYKINQNLVKITVPSNLLISPRITRNNDPNKFVQIQCRTNLLAYSFYPHTNRIWNTLPSKVLLLPFSSFKLAVRALPLAAPAHLSRFQTALPILAALIFTCTLYISPMFVHSHSYVGPRTPYTPTILEISRNYWGQWE